MGSVISASALTENKLEWDRGIFAFIVIRLVWRKGFFVFAEQTCRKGEINGIQAEYRPWRDRRDT